MRVAGWWSTKWGTQRFNSLAPGYGHRDGRLIANTELTVKDAEAAIEFYGAAFDAVEHTRFKAPTGHVVAEMSIDGLRFFVVDENRQAFN